MSNMLGKTPIREDSGAKIARLKAEGNIDEYRQVIIDELDAGKTKKEAKLIAHHRFPPPGMIETPGEWLIGEAKRVWLAAGKATGAGDLELPGSLKSVPTVAPVGPPPLSDGDAAPEIDLSTPDARRDAYWAYNHIGKKGISESHAPSQGAWNMLFHFGRNSGSFTRFVEKIVEPLFKSEPKGERYSDDGRELIALCERFRAEKVVELAEEAA